jgi:hypothetical protein
VSGGVPMIDVLVTGIERVRAPLPVPACLPGRSDRQPASRSFGPRLSAGIGRTGAALGRTHPANPSAVLTMLSDSGIAPPPGRCLVAACHELIRRLAGHTDDLAAGPGQLPAMPQSPAHNGRSGIRGTHGSPFAIRPYSAFGCRKGTQGRQHLSLYLAHKLRRVADASVPVAERAWYLFPAPEPLYCAPSPGKGGWASLSSVMSATRVALFGG